MKAKYITILVVSLLGITSCSDLLDIEPAMSLSEETAIKTRKDVLNAVNGCYDALQRTGYYGRDMVVIGDVPTDNLDATGTIADFRSIDLFSHKADNSIVLNLWASMYDAVNRINNVLFRIDLVADMTEQAKTGVKAELRFLRALHYFNLVRLFGDVPYREMPTLNAGSAVHMARTPKAQIYQKIIDDLTFAEQNLTTGSNVKANLFAAKALMAKVFLTTEQFNLAYDKARDVIVNGGYSLSTFESLFNDTSNEIIFQVDFNEQDKTILAQYFAPNTLGGRKEFWPTTSIVSAYAANDARKAATIGPQGQGYKFRDIATGVDNVIVLRLADMYLTRAEAGLNTTIAGYTATNARADINAVRNRAGLANFGGTDGQLLAEIALQRRLEFAFEGHRWFDLVRTNTATVVLGIDANKTLFPIPESEIINNNLIGPANQNPGY